MDQTASAESFAFTTRLRPGRERAYERFHRAIPAELDRTMRAAGVLGWRIHRSGLTLTHHVEASDRARMEAALDADPVNAVWQRRVAPFLDPLGDPGAPDPAAPLVWDLSWPVARPLGLGTAQLGNLLRERSDEEARAILEAAWECGIRHFDTAPHYGLGLSERRLGDFLRDKPRAEFTISTKVGRMLVPNPAGAASQDDEGFAVPAAFRREWDFSAEGVLASMEASRERLGLERIDTVLIHDPNAHAEQALGEAAPALIALRDAGAVSSVGVGNRDTALLTRFVRETDIDVVMLAGRYTLLEQSALDELLPACLDSGVTVLNAAVFNSGVLAQDHPASDARFEYGPVSAAVLDRAREAARLCEEHGTRLPAAALAFAAAHPAVGELVVGADDDAQLRSTARLLESPPPAALWPALLEAGLLRPDAPWPVSA